MNNLTPPDRNDEFQSLSDDDCPFEFQLIQSSQQVRRLELVKPVEPLTTITISESIKINNFDSDKLYEIANKYQTFSLLSTYFRSQNYKIIDSFVIGSCLSSLSYLYSHSYQVGQDNVSRKMSLNLFIMLAENTGFEKTGSLNCVGDIVGRINKVVAKKFEMNLNHFTTSLPSSREGLQRLAGLAPTMFFRLDEAASYLKAKEYSPKFEVLEALRNLFDPYAFGLSFTKKDENNNVSTSECIANLLFGCTPEDVKKGLLNKERIENGTANRFIIVTSNTTRVGSKKSVRIAKDFIDNVIFTHIEKMAETHIKYDCEFVANEFNPLADKVKKHVAVAKQILSAEIEAYYEKISEKNDQLLDEYDAKGAKSDNRVIMLTRQMVIKKRIAYLLFIDSGFKNDLQCAKDADFILDQLNLTFDSLFEESAPTADILKEKIMGLKDKYKPGEKIYISKLTRPKALLDSKRYSHLLDLLPNYLQQLAKLGILNIDVPRYGEAKSFSFNPD